jgi:sulfur carrier protein ThiS
MNIFVNGEQKPVATEMKLINFLDKRDQDLTKVVIVYNDEVRNVRSGMKLFCGRMIN